jgi:hypothetical protein
MATMKFGLAKDIHVVFHTPRNPSDAEWTTYMDDLHEHGPAIQGVLVHSLGGGPSPTQRKRLKEVWGEHAQKPVALMSSSRIFRGIITAILWVMPNHALRIFPIDDFAGAFAHLGASELQKARVLEVLAKLKRELEIEAQAS